MATFPTSFDRTYEGLKQALSKAWRFMTKAFDRTYEGLKPWNPRLSGDGLQAFDRTYEGLKQVSVVVEELLKGNVPFDRTYEGLKHDHDGDVVPGHGPFDRTYEGLKPGRCLPPGLLLLILLTVPMRV